VRPGGVLSTALLLLSGVPEQERDVDGSTGVSSTANVGEIH